MLAALERIAFPSRGSWKVSLWVSGSQREETSLPLAQGERQGNRRKLLLHLLRAEAAAPVPLLALPPAAASGRPGVTTVLSFPTPAATAKCARGENWSLSDKRAQGLGPERSSDCKLESQTPSAAPGCCAGRPVPHSSAGLFLSNLQF